MGGGGGCLLSPFPCKSKSRYPLSLNVLRKLFVKVREHAGEVLGEKIAPFPALFGGKKKRLPQIFLVTFVLKIKKV